MVSADSRAHFAHDPVDHPRHYTAHPSGVECITITEHMGLCIGNAIKYLWRADEKDNAIEDLQKARWYINRESARRTKQPATGDQVDVNTEGITR